MSIHESSRQMMRMAGDHFRREAEKEALATMAQQQQLHNLKQNQASEFYKQLCIWINEFHEGLDNESEVGVRLASFGTSIVFHLREIDYSDPSLIVFRGETDTVEHVELIQHVSQISILLMKVKRLDPSKDRGPFGIQPKACED